MDGSELRHCSAGIFDVEKLRCRGHANPDSFSFEEFLKRTPDWGDPDARPKTEYPISRNVTSNSVGEDLSDHSINKVQTGGKNRNLHGVIHDYMLTLNGVKHMLCIHSRTNPHSYYSQTILKAANMIHRRSSKFFPVVLIITRTDQMAESTCKSLKATQNRNRYLSGCKIMNLVNNLPAGPRLIETNNRRPQIDVAVGSALHVINYFKKVHSELEYDLLMASVKHAIVISAEALPVDQTFYEACRYIARELRFSPTRFMFMYNFVLSRCSPLRMHEACDSLVKGLLYIEVERQEVCDTFDRIEFQSIVAAEEFVDGLVALKISNGEEIHEKMFDAARVIMTPQAQKLHHCQKLIMNLRLERQKSNQERRRSRKERILIVTKDSTTATLVLMFLHMRRAEGDLDPFQIDKIVINDSYEDVEMRNFDFRWGDLDVLVIDWMSIRAVNRGTVDAVIVFDSPEEKYFQTMIEAEIQSLISRNCVRIKLFIMFDQEDDIMLLVKYAKLLEKYNKRAPQWFVALYDKYLQKWYETRDADRTLQNSRDADETLQ